MARSCIDLAAKIYIACDRFSPGVESEFLAIQAAEREDDTFILLPGPDQEEHYRELYSLATRIDDAGPVHSKVLSRKLATFGLICTTDEMGQVLEMIRPH